MNESITIEEYKNQMTRILKITYPQLGINEIRQAVDYSVQKRYKQYNVSLFNNYKNREVKDITLLQLADTIKTKKPIISSYGVLFQRHKKDSNSSLYNLLESFIKNRDKNKATMFKYPKGSEEFDHYNRMQNLDKLDANALYGNIGQRSSMLYNVCLAQSITSQGRACISAAILFFEQFLADNFKWMNLDEIINFIDEVIHQDKWIYNDIDLKLKNHDVAEVFFKIMKNCGFNGYRPTDRDMNVIWTILSRCNQAQLNRLYYRNNLYEFCDNESIQTAIIYILQRLEKPFENPNKPNNEIKVELDCLTDIIKDYVYHPHLNMNRIDRVLLMNRKVSIITDTDSSIVSFDHWYHYVLNWVSNVPLTINSWRGDLYYKKKQSEIKPEPLYRVVKDSKGFDFYNGEIVYETKLDTLYYKDPRDNLRHSIINIMAYMISVLIGDYMEKLAEDYNTHDGSKKCLIIMKNEFLFKRVLIMDGKKNYASIQELQEGNKIPPDKALDIKGMMIDKSVLPNVTRKRLKQILQDYVLNAEHIDQIEVIKQLAIFEKEIYQSLINGEKTFYKPVNIKSINGYDDPMGQFGFKAAATYNYLRNTEETPINLEQRNRIILINLDMNKNNIDKIKDTYPEVYEKAVELMKLKEYNGIIKHIGILADEPIPKWVLEFVDYTSIINNNIKNFPINQIGLTNYDKKAINYTNILKF